MAFFNKYRVDNFIIGDDFAFIRANIKELIRVSNEIYVVKSETENRLDLISELLYGTPYLKWVLIYVNKIYDVMDISVGTRIYYPLYNEYKKLMYATLERK